MDDHILNLPWGNATISPTLPANWCLSGVLEPSALPGANDAATEVQRSLQEPIGSPRLRDITRRGMKVSIVIDDVSRTTPAASILPTVLHDVE
jgi:nickel-dependent lactate racemase